MGRMDLSMEPLQTLPERQLGKRGQNQALVLLPLFSTPWPSWAQLNYKKKNENKKQIFVLCCDLFHRIRWWYFRAAFGLLTSWGGLHDETRPQRSTVIKQQASSLPRVPRKPIQHPWSLQTRGLEFCLISWIFLGHEGPAGARNGKMIMWTRFYKDLVGTKHASYVLWETGACMKALSEFLTKAGSDLQKATPGSGWRFSGEVFCWIKVSLALQDWTLGGIW